VDSGTGHPRKYYKLTDAGRQRVKEMSRAWAEFSDKLNGILKSIGMKG
jgi:DNA-binding PadR family transcriptional regulator